MGSNTCPIGEGVIGVSATSSNRVCTAQVIDASARVPNGIDFHGAGFNPIAGTQGVARDARSYDKLRIPPAASSQSAG